MIQQTNVNADIISRDGGASAGKLGVSSIVAGRAFDYVALPHSFTIIRMKVE